MSLLRPGINEKHKHFIAFLTFPLVSQLFILFVTFLVISQFGSVGLANLLPTKSLSISQLLDNGLFKTNSIWHIYNRVILLSLQITSWTKNKSKTINHIAQNFLMLTHT